MAKFVSLFRAINVGGNNRVNIAALREIHQKLGFKNISSYLQTGNVVFESDVEQPAQIVQQLTAEFEQQFGFHSEVILRTPNEMQEVIAKNPFLDQPERESKFLLVFFLAAAPTAEAKKALLEYSGPEEIFITEKEVYVYYPAGMGTSKFSNVLIEKRLKVLGTGRNWNTTTKLLAMLQD